ncbi:MAG TPA: hypothetical protein DHU33_04160 [Firmicutes bacterium]|nr:hypothetical protein [Bacillota bacterium]
MKNNKTFNKLKFIVFSFLIFITNMNISYAANETGTAACKGLFGDTLTGMVQDALDLMKIAGPILVIVMTIIDLIKAVASGGKDDLSKLGTKTLKRLIYAVLLFVIPSLLDWLFSLFSIYGTCGLS